jgi:hypothetical protein
MGNTRQRKRTEWLSKVTKWRRVGVERAFGLDVLTTRVRRKPPVWLVENSNGARLFLWKAPRGSEKRFLWRLGDPVEHLCFATRAAALRAAAGLRPRKDAPVEEGHSL